MSWSDVSPVSMPGAREIGPTGVEDPYGECNVCERETTDVHHADEEGVTFRCERCDEILRDVMNESEEEITRTIRDLEDDLEVARQQVKRAHKGGNA